MKVSRRQVLQALVGGLIVGSCASPVMAIADGAKPFIKVSVNYKVRGTIPTLHAVGAVVRLYRGNTLLDSKRTGADGQVMWERLASASNYRVHVTFRGQSQWFTGGGGDIPIGPGSAKRPGVFFWVEP